MNFAKQNQSDDNISVIVVYLTPPEEVAAKSFFNPRPNIFSMESSGPLQADHHSQSATNLGIGMDLDQQQREQLDHDGFGLGFGGKLSSSDDFEPFPVSNNVSEHNNVTNGRLSHERPAPPRYNDDDDDDQAENDFGPETDVDALDEAGNAPQMTGGSAAPVDFEMPKDLLQESLDAERIERPESKFYEFFYLRYWYTYPSLRNIALFKNRS